MLKYIARRVLQFIPVFFGVTLALFLIANYLPGADPVQMRVGERAMNPQLKAELRHQYGFDRPWYVQYAQYLSNLSPVHLVTYGAPAAPGAPAEPRQQVGHVVVMIPLVTGPAPSAPVTIVSGPFTYVRGQLGRIGLGNTQIAFDPPDLGTSVMTGRSVNQILAETYPYTIKLALFAIAIEIFIGVGAGIVSAVKQYSFWDVFVTLTTSILVSLPVFWLGLLLQYFFGILMKQWTGGTFYLPISGATGIFPDFAYLILPGITLASVSTAYAARIMRSQLLEVNNQDYIRTAHAKGLSGSRVLWNHALKNAMIPVVTFIGLDLGAMFAGAVLTETVFNWPGVGFTIARAIFARDFPIVFGGVTVMLFAVMLVNLLVDLSYAFLDPRIRYGGGAE